MTLHLRAAISEPPQRLRQDAMAGSGARQHLDRAARLVTQAVGQRAHALQPVIDAFYLAIECACLRGLLQPSLHAMEQRKAQLILGVEEHLADSRLGDAQQTRLRR